jgi:tetratricopeptide (TPR) repeat protein
MASEPVSPDPPSAPAEKQSSRLGVVDGFLAVLICGVAFLLASTPARNSDLWLHLATGRWLSTQRLPDGTDPFSFATQGVFWVDHTWLSDILLYQIYKLGNGAALVVAKAVVTALLAALVLCFRRRGESIAVPALAGFAAVLALGPWLILHPNLLSLLGVLVTLYLLERPALLDGAAAERARAERWLLVPLFALWANLDGWFILGPILVGLYALGSRKVRSEEWGVRRENHSSLLTPHASLLFCVGLAACLATPYHYRIFAWPASLGLTHTEQVLRGDPLGPNLVLSPFGERFAASPFFRSPGTWAYYFLLTAGAISFVLSMRNLHPGRLLVWLALAALSIYQARMIPFFAVVAAPVLALNVQEWACSRPAFQRPLTLLTRRLGILVGVVLLVLVWPGWLQLAPYQPRDWAIEPDGSLVRMDEYLKREHARGAIRPDRFALTFSPEAAHYLAWFCPEEKGFVDSRWPLFDAVADDYVRMRRCLFEGESNNGQELASLLDAHRIDRVLLYDADRGRMERAYRHLFQAAGSGSGRSVEWELLAVEGGAALFRRRDGTAPSPQAFEYRRAAYRPTLDKRAPPAAQPPEPPRWFDAFRRRPDPGSADREEAALHLLSFELQTRELANHWLLAQATRLTAPLPFAPPLPPSPPEPLLLAVRAARRALAVNPQDARAFLLLGQAYLQLARHTREPSWQTLLPELGALRQAQILTALEQAVLLRRDLAQAHALLAQIYYEMGQMDRRLDHLRALLQFVEQADKHASATDALRADVESAQKLVNESEKTYRANLTGKTDPSKVLDRAQLAARYGLSRKALEMMKESYPAIFGRAGVEYQLDLMIKAGQSYEILAELEPEHERMIDFAVYHWIEARAAASCGDYAQADAELDAGNKPYRRIGLSRRLFVPVRSAVALHVARAVLSRPPEAEGVAGRLIALRWQFRTLEILGTAAEPLLREADREVLRGLLALEAGEVEAAKQHFRAALDVWGSDAAAKSGAGLDFPARPIAQEMLRRIEE